MSKFPKAELLTPARRTVESQIGPGITYTYCGAPLVDSLSLSPREQLAVHCKPNAKKLNLLSRLEDRMHSLQMNHFGLNS